MNEMDLESHRVEMIGGPFDGERMVNFTGGNTFSLSLPSGTMVHYVMWQGKYHFDRYLSLKKQNTNPR